VHANIPYLREILLFLAVAGLVIPVVHRLKMSPVLGFLCAGLVVGPHGLGRFVAAIPALDAFVIADPGGMAPIAEFGVVFLLLTIGLELSLPQLWAMRRLVFGLGAAQVAVTSIVIGVIAYLFGNALAGSVILGLCLSLSSTAIVVQILTERLRLGTPTGRTSFGVLLFQDLAVVPILFLIGVLGTRASGSLLGTALHAFGGALLAIATILAIGRLLVRPLLRFVGATGSRELFMAAVLLLVVGTAALTAAAGLSMALGAFLAGLLFAGTEYRHQINSDIEPFKGLLLGLFFMSVGMSLDVAAVWADLDWILLSVAGLVVIKATILFVLGRAMGLPLSVAAESAILLGEGGEFAAVAIGAALAAGLFAPDLAQFMLLVVVVTMFLTPLLAAFGRRIGRMLEKAADAAEPDVASDAQGHIVIGGFGRVGQLLGSMLESQRIPYQALDSDPHLVARLRERGMPVFFGDASSSAVLAHLGIGNASAFVTTMEGVGRTERIVAAVSRHWPHVPIYARARDPQHARRLEACGAFGAVPEITEASLQLGEQLLVGIGIPEEAARALVADHRIAAMGESVRSDRIEPSR
jgi:CPA2 family monovalent cation:H+ antiporter-2